MEGNASYKSSSQKLTEKEMVSGLSESYDSGSIIMGREMQPKPQNTSLRS